MQIGDFLYSVIILPIEAVIEFVFNFSISKMSMLGAGGAIVLVSLTVNFLALPLYNIADEIQLKERAAQKRMEKWTSHIKKTFKGDEQYMMLNAYYRINNYSPVYALRSSLSILIEIPFFIAAYNYLSKCDVLLNQSFFILENLGKPDTLIKTENTTIHVLPIIMTVINCVSGFVYSKDAPPREKVQIYVLAAIFLFLLYDSPSGLVFYWILNNLFSLAKNIIQKYVKNPGIIVAACFDIIFAFASLYFMFFKPETGFKKKCVVYLASLVVFVLPFILNSYSKFFEKRKIIFNENKKSYFLAFIFSALGMAILCGLYLTSSMISTSPVEFSFLGNTDSPLSYLTSSFAFALGLFVLWPLAVYLMFSDKVKYALTYIFVWGGVSVLFNSLVFRQNYGTVSIFGELDNSSPLKHLTVIQLAGPALVIVILTAIILLLENKKKLNYIFPAMLSVCLVYTGISCKNIVSINSVYKEASAKKIPAANTANNKQIPTVYSLSKSGKNVFVLFLDRAIGIFTPYIFEEFPELKSTYSGFTFYPNTISFSDSTNKAAPALYGGYEYTPEQMNLRKDELLLEKNNEALLVLPRIFSDAGWQVTDFDPQNPNYSSTDDFSPFEGLHNTKVLSHVSGISEKYISDHPELSEFSNADLRVKKTLPKFALLQMLVPIARNTYYNGAKYFSGEYISLSKDFIKSFSELYYLRQMTDFKAERNTYTIMHNMLTHNPTLLKQPGYMPSKNLSGIPAGSKCTYPYSIHNDYSDIKHYEVNASALLRIADWLNFLKENHCYNNTKIIIVSDHGFRDTIQYLAPGFSRNTDYGCYQPLLMVKDFNAEGEIKTDNTFMTNADTPELTLKNLGLADSNPFTGKKFSSDKTGGFNLYNANMTDRDYDPSIQKKNTQFNLYLERGFHVQDNIFNQKNWIPLDKWFESNPSDKERAALCGVKVNGEK